MASLLADASHGGGGSAGGQGSFPHSGAVEPFLPNGTATERSFHVEWSRAGGGQAASPHAGTGASGWNGIGSAAAAIAAARTVGPGSYSPRHHLREPTAPAVPFGTASRFLPANVSYISPRHNAGLLCAEGPGPKYSTPPTAATYPRAPALGWGDKATAGQRQKKASFIPPIDNDVGPANYSPRHATIKPAAPKCSFARSERFGGAGSYQVLTNTTSSGAVTALNPSLEAVVPASPRFSFGPPRPAAGEREGATDALGRPIATSPRATARTAIFTHNIRGGLAKPATLECNIGPGDYAPRNFELGAQAEAARAASGAATAGRGFGTERRFVKPELLFSGAGHAQQTVGQASPGPKYLPTTNNTAQRALSRSPRGGMGGQQWVP